jgi:hypothetical protein
MYSKSCFSLLLGMSFQVKYAVGRSETSGFLADTADEKPRQPFRPPGGGGGGPNPGGNGGGGNGDPSGPPENVRHRVADPGEEPSTSGGEERELNFLGMGLNFLGVELSFLGYMGLSFLGYMELSFLRMELNFLGAELSFLGMELNFLGI